MTAQTVHFEMALSIVFKITAAAHRVLSAVSLKGLALHNAHASSVGTATLNKAGATPETEMIRSVPNHDLPSEQGTDHFDICIVVILDLAKDLMYP